jgi:uncharacterized protein YecE (DUF72 family)
MSKNKKFFIGTSGWDYSDWQGIFYPDGWPKSRKLEYYATRFDVVEINATFYRFFKNETYIKWRDRVPEKFRYVLKTPRFITHRKYLNDCDDVIKQFCQSAILLESKLALILLQIAPNMPYNPEKLQHALTSFSDPQKVVVEFRDHKWLTTEIKNLLKELNSIFCIVDSPTWQLHDYYLTSEIAYIRLHGHKQWYTYNYTKAELKEIATLAQHLIKKGTKEVYIFFNNDYAGYAVQNALQLMELLDYS